jgi:hypothetical protein
MKLFLCKSVRLKLKQIAAEERNCVAWVRDLEKRMRQEDIRVTGGAK